MHQIPRMMDHRHDGAEEAAHARSLRDLMERRDRLTGWLSRLESETGANEAVVARIREDYQAQLDSVMSELAGHYDAVCAQRADLDGEVERLRSESAAARDALEEAELRHRIGEYDDETWESRRSELQPTVDSAAAELERMLRETDELDQVIAELRDGLAPDGAGPLPRLGEPESDRTGGTPESGEAYDRGETHEGAQPHEAVEAMEVAEAVEAVDESLERGREESHPPTAAADGDDGASEENGATRPSPGVKCGECGYTNDYGALFCGVCGVDLA